jgi:hypothetical protein
MMAPEDVPTSAPHELHCNCNALWCGVVCCALFAALQEDTSWVAMKTFLGKRSVKEDILNFDAHRILSTPGEGQQGCNMRPLSCMPAAM